MAFALRRPYGNRRARRAAADGELAADQSAAPARGGRFRLAAGRGAWAMGSLLLALARIVRLLVTLLVALIVVAIVLRLLSANPGNTIVSDIHDAARTVVAPFDNLFKIKDPKVAIAVNWGVAAVVYMIVGGLIARLIARAAPRGLPPERVA